MNSINNNQQQNYMQKSHAIGVRFKSETLSKLKEEAEEGGRSISSHVSHLCDKHVAGRGEVRRKPS